MKQIIRNKMHDYRQSVDCKILEHNGQKIKIVYQAYNANEICVAKVWSGKKWNEILNMMEAGIDKDCQAYNTLSASERDSRATWIFLEMEKQISKILD